MRTFSLDMIPGGAQTAVSCNQYESGDVWLFSLYYDGGRYEIPTGAEVSITGTKPDGAAYKIAGTVVNNAVQIVVTDQITACAGRSIAEILVEADDTTLYSANFPLLIEPAAVQGELSPSVIPTAIVDTEGNIYYEGKSIMGFYPVESASGDIAVIHDGADSLPVRDLSVAIEPAQAGTGTPSPSNVRAITGWDAVKVARTSRNIIDVYPRTGSASGVTYTNNADGSVTLNGTATSAGGASLPRLTTERNLKTGAYYARLFGNNLTGLTMQAYSNGISIFNRQSGSFIIPDDGTANFMRVRWDSGTVLNNVTVYPMLVEGTEEPTAYEYPQADTHTIDLPSTVYGGTLDVTTGILTVDRAMVDLGSLSWGYASTRFYATAPADSVGISDTGDLQAVCDSFARYETGSLADMPDASFFVNSNKMSATVKRIAVKDSRYTDAGAFKTAMSGVMLCYTLATPQTYTLTPVQVKTLLGENRIYADAGDVTVEYRVDFNAAGLMYIPKAPTADGAYRLTADVSGGTPTYRWEAE